MQGTMWKVIAPRSCEGVLWRYDLSTNILFHQVRTVWRPEVYGPTQKVPYTQLGETILRGNRLAATLSCH